MSPGKPGAQDCAALLPQSRMPSRPGRRVFLLQAEGVLVSVHAPWKILYPPPRKPPQSRQGLSQTHRTQRRLFFPEARSSPRGHRSQDWWASFWQLRALGRVEHPTDKVRATCMSEGRGRGAGRNT